MTQLSRYSSVPEVVALTRHLLDGQPTYNLTTRPTIIEVERILDQVSAELNMALAGMGFVVPLTNSIAVLGCSSWVARQAATVIELTQRSAGWTGDQAMPRLGPAGATMAAAQEFATHIAPALRAQGAETTEGADASPTFTALSVHELRPDAADTSMVQPMFRRGMFDL